MTKSAQCAAAELNLQGSLTWTGDAVWPVSVNKLDKDCSQVTTDIVVSLLVEH